MRTLSRLITGGLVGLACVLAALGHSMWIAHAVAAVFSFLAVVLASQGRRRGSASGWWLLVPPVALIAVYFYAWF
ncbi:hypothetical protein ACUY3M_04075 [Corynebacterium suicordis]|uniref:Secreted protein n=1 Tax=Corynebacterium suicordis DSM 45110 TaxID=1121369 RepID=A0ABR9ZII4_9CORY|nr:hypothetical protein [Corynebacterium suicordis]MBF4553258.1 hypothetical protein [Corynebacterium suicordis DSM 45110]MDR6277772.1 hypothetical protein [Corynebacterium suicordis]